MASISVSHTTPTLVASSTGANAATAANPYQFSLRFAESVTGVIYLAYANSPADAATKCTALLGWPWPDTEVFSGTLVAGQKIYGLAKGASDLEIRSLDVAP